MKCKYCHGDQEVAKIAQQMGFRHDIAFLRIQKLENALHDLIEESEIFLQSKQHKSDTFIFEGMVDKCKYLLK